MFSDGSRPGMVFIAHTYAEVAEDNEPLCFWDRGYEGVKLFIKPVFDLIRVGHGWGVGTY